jgi:septum formation protein
MVFPVFFVVSTQIMASILQLNGGSMIFLASQSPRRSELLTQLGVRFELIEVSVHEQRQPEETPLDYVNRVSREKAGAGLMALSGVANAVVLGADTDVVLDGNVFGKPADADEARTMLKALSGRTHEVITAVWLVSAGREQHRISRTQVTFSALSESDIDAYIASNEPFGRAGSYAIQGLGAAFVSRIEGSYSGVMGLPLYETAQLLRNFGIGFGSKPV